MKGARFDISLPDFLWIDLINPSAARLKEIGKQFNLSQYLLNDSLDPEHLPKYERTQEADFFILRAYDDESTSEADTVHELSRKIACFWGKDFLITVHRRDQNYIQRLRQKWSTPPPDENNASLLLVADLINSALQSYEAPIDQAENKLEKCEMDIFAAPGAQPFEIQTGYYLKRRASVIKRILRLSSDVLHRLQNLSRDQALFQDLKELLERQLFYAEELHENANSLLNLHISLSSQKTNEASHRANEVMRLLTVFSVFFLPLNFIASIYGMNFVHMPELQSHYGYPIVLIAMIVVAAIIYIWFKRKGWTV